MNQSTQYLKSEASKKREACLISEASKKREACLISEASKKREARLKSEASKKREALSLAIKKNHLCYFEIQLKNQDSTVTNRK
jgi:hypothetical protein